MFNLEKFIADSVTSRPVSMFAADIEANKETLTAEIKGKKVCVIGGAGSIGSSFIKAVLRFEPASIVVVDLNENGLAELVRDVRSTESLYVPEESAILSTLQTKFSNVFSAKRKVLISSQTSLLTSMCVQRRINIPFRRSSRTMTLRPRN